MRNAPKVMGWNEAIEAAAKVCEETAALQDEMARVGDEMERYRKARAWDAWVCAAKIRALKIDASH